jgi:hypothetical protein
MQNSVAKGRFGVDSGYQPCASGSLATPELGWAKTPPLRSSQEPVPLQPRVLLIVLSCPFYGVTPDWRCSNLPGCGASRRSSPSVARGGTWRARQDLPRCRRRSRRRGRWRGRLRRRRRGRIQHRRRCGTDRPDVAYRRRPMRGRWVRAGLLPLVKQQQPASGIGERQLAPEQDRDLRADELGDRLEEPQRLPEASETGREQLHVARSRGRDLACWCAPEPRTGDAGGGWMTATISTSSLRWPGRSIPRLGRRGTGCGGRAASTPIGWTRCRAPSASGG